MIKTFTCKTCKKVIFTSSYSVPQDECDYCKKRGGQKNEKTIETKEKENKGIR